MSATVQEILKEIDWLENQITASMPESKKSDIDATIRELYESLYLQARYDA